MACLDRGKEIPSVFLGKLREVSPGHLALFGPQPDYDGASESACLVSQLALGGGCPQHTCRRTLMIASPMKTRQTTAGKYSNTKN